MCENLRSTDPFYFSALVAVIFLAATPVKAQEGEAGLQINKQLQMVPKNESPGVEKTEKPQPVVRDPRVLNAAKMYEKYFLGQMMKAMRSTVNRSELEKQSMGEGIYREQLDDQYVDSWGERGGIGLADMIHDELVGKAEMMKLRRQAMRAAKGKVRTPMALTDRDVLKIRKLPGVKNVGGASVETLLVSLGRTTARPEDGPESVRSPWAGRISSIRSENGKVVIGLDTATESNGPSVGSTAPRKVELAFDGVTFDVTEGAVVKAGQTIGHLGQGARGILVRQTLVQAAIKSPDESPVVDPAVGEL